MYLFLLTVLAGAAAEPWDVLDAVRRELAAAGTVLVDFAIDGDHAPFPGAAGELVLALPDCVRWRSGTTVLVLTSDAAGARGAAATAAQRLLLADLGDLAAGHQLVLRPGRPGAVGFLLLATAPDADPAALELVVQRTGARLEFLGARSAAGDLVRVTFSAPRTGGPPYVCSE